MVHSSIKEYVEKGDASSLVYFFCDSLDGDPTFEEYKEDYEYCKSKGIPFKAHAELHPMSLSVVNEEYWVQLKKDFMENPSVERMEHMRKAAQVLYKDRIQRIQEEKAREAENVRRIKEISKKKIEAEESKLEIQNDLKAKERTPVTPIGNVGQKFSSTQEGAVRRASERVVSNSDGVRRTVEPSDKQPKKDLWVGVIGAVAAVLVVVILGLVILIILK